MVALGDGGRDLYHADRRDRVPLPRFQLRHSPGGEFSSPSSSCGLRWQIPLRNLTFDVNRIRTLRGALAVPLPVRLDTSRILFGEAKGAVRIGPVDLAWQAPVNPAAASTNRLRPGSRDQDQEMSLTVVSRRPARVFWMAIDAAGRAGRPAC